MKQPAISESYFQNELEKRARQDALAAPLLGIDQNLDLSHLAPPHIALVKRAFEFAKKAHRGQQRRTGHSYITHPLAVADILTQYRLDHETICAALLHDVLEDTDSDKATLTKTFGPAIADIVDGVSKLSHLFDSRDEAQAQNFYKMAMAMARDIRVILVKLADRLHNMRTIGVMTRPARKRIAQETLELYVPLALRLGMFQFKAELEHLSFEALYPLRADRLQRYITRVREDDTQIIADVTKNLQLALRKAKVSAKVDYFKPEHYTLYLALKGQRLTKEECMDRFTFRVVVSDREDCYRALGVVHTVFKPKHRSFKDYIAIPKKNGYQSLHTTLFSSHGERAVSLKLLIRTDLMNEIADFGFVAGWRHRDENTDASEDSHSTSSGGVKEWIQGLLNLQEGNDASEFVEDLKADLFPDQVYVFTPRGDILTLPVGACVIDFAYAVHTDVGNECVGCQIDGQYMPLTSILESGQTVTIVRELPASPDPEWLHCVKTVRARAAIRNYLRHQSRNDAIMLGETLLDRILATAETSVKELDFRRLRRTFKEFKVRRLDELFAEIGLGVLSAHKVAERLLEVDAVERDMSNFNRCGPILVESDQQVRINYASCCGPIPGDQIVGNVTKEEGMVLHRKSCREVKNSTDPSNLLPARWADSPEGEYVTPLSFDITPFEGTLAPYASLVNSLGAGIRLIEVQDRTTHFSTVRMHVSVKDLKHLNRLTKHLSNRTDTANVRRYAD